MGPAQLGPGCPLWVEGAPYLSLRFVRLHQLHHLPLLHQDDLGVPEPSDVQRLSRDERAHTCAATLQPLQGEKTVRVRVGPAPAPQAHTVRTERLLAKRSARKRNGLLMHNGPCECHRIRLRGKRARPVWAHLYETGKRTLNRLSCQKADEWLSGRQVGRRTGRQGRRNFWG